MTPTLILVVTVALLVLSGLWLAYRTGKSQKARDDAEDKADEMAHDAEVAAKPYSSSPLGDVRRMSGEE